MRLYLSRIEGPPPKRNAPGSNPGKRATSEQAMYRLLRFFCKNRSALMPLLLLFRKKSRSARLFACKRAHDGSRSLPAFCELTPLPPASKVGRVATRQGPGAISRSWVLSYAQNNCPRPERFQMGRTYCQARAWSHFALRTFSYPKQVPRLLWGSFLQGEDRWAFVERGRAGMLQ